MKNLVLSLGILTSLIAGNASAAPIFLSGAVVCKKKGAEKGKPVLKIGLSNEYVEKLVACDDLDELTPACKKLKEEVLTAGQIELATELGEELEDAFSYTILTGIKTKMLKSFKAKAEGKVQKHNVSLDLNLTTDPREDNEYLDQVGSVKVSYKNKTGKTVEKTVELECENVIVIAIEGD